MSTKTGIDGRTTETGERVERAKPRGREPTYTGDLRDLVALASIPPKKRDPDDPISLTAPPSVREAIRLSGGVLHDFPLPPAAPPAPHPADAPPAAPRAAPRSALGLVALRFAAVPLVALVLGGAALASMRGADRAPAIPAPSTPAPVIEPPRVTTASIRLPAPVQVVEASTASLAPPDIGRAAPTSKPAALSPKPAAPRPRPAEAAPTATASASAAPEPPSLMDAMKEAVQSAHRR